MKNEGSVSGLATAAGIWSTGAIGYATAQGLYLTALSVSLANLIIIQARRRPKDERV